MSSSAFRRIQRLSRADPGSDSCLARRQCLERTSTQSTTAGAAADEPVREWPVERRDRCAHMVGAFGGSIGVTRISSHVCGDQSDWPQQEARATGGPRRTSRRLPNPAKFIGSPFALTERAVMHDLRKLYNARKRRQLDHADEFIAKWRHDHAHRLRQNDSAQRLKTGHTNCACCFVLPLLDRQQGWRAQPLMYRPPD
ncbi:hypothetical protein ACVIGB_008547 [Bradyrhizobium sp. USDA 4341]